MRNSAHVVGTLLVAAFLLWFPVVARPALGAPTLSSAPVPKAQTAAQRYEELVARVKKGDLDVDFGELRYAYSESTGYRPYGGPAERPVGEMFRAYKAQDFDGAIAAAKKVLALNYLDIDAHIVCDLSYRMASNAIAAEPYHQMAIRLLGSIYQSGDGASPETAYQIIAVREEYAVLNTLGLAPTNHRQLVQDTHRFDVFDATDKSSGEIKTIYFNVDRPLAWLEKHPPAPAKD